VISMHRFVPTAVVIAFLLGIVYLVWTIMTSVLYDPTSGLTKDLDDMAQEDMEGEYLKNWNEHHDRDDDSFGFIIIHTFLNGVTIRAGARKIFRILISRAHGFVQIMKSMWEKAPIIVSRN